MLLPSEDEKTDLTQKLYQTRRRFARGTPARLPFPAREFYPPRPLCVCVLRRKRGTPSAEKKELLEKVRHLRPLEGKRRRPPRPVRSSGQPRRRHGAARAALQAGDNPSRVWQFPPVRHRTARKSIADYQRHQREPTEEGASKSGARQSRARRAGLCPAPDLRPARAAPIKSAQRRRSRRRRSAS